MNSDTPASIVLQPLVLYFGTPVALVTTLDERGTANITPMSSAWALDDRLVLGLGAQSQGCVNLLRQREAVINLPEPALWPAIEKIARTTGRDPVPAGKRALGFRHESDKFRLAGLTRAASHEVAPPRIAECPLQLETRLVHARPAAAAHGEAPDFHVLEVAVVKVHAHPQIVLAGTQHIDTGRWSPLLYVFRHYFGTGGRLGRNFRAEH